MEKTSAKAPRLSEQRKGELLFFAESINMRFADPALLDTALTHSSYANENSVTDNERLEFLGDSVLHITVTDYLYKKYNFNEGESSKIRSYVVSEESLCTAAKALDLGKYLNLGKGVEQNNGREQKSILADAMEAVFACCYLENGLEVASQFILSLLKEQIEACISMKKGKDYKTILQEYVQKRWKKVPSYTLVRTEGPANALVFYMCVEVNGKTYGPVEGNNKKAAELKLAEAVCRELKIKG